MLVRESAYLFLKIIEYVKILDLIFHLLFMSQKVFIFFIFASNSFTTSLIQVENYHGWF